MTMATRFGSALLAALLAGCATTVPGPALEVTADCQVRPGAGSGGAPAGGFSLGFGGGPGQPNGPVAATSDGVLAQGLPSTTSDGPPSSTSTGSDGGRHKSSGPSAGAVAAGIAVLFGGAILANQASAGQVLRNDGPVLPAEFSMNCVPVRGFVQGGWPMVLDYVADGSANPSLEIHLGEGGPAYVRALDGGRGRHYLRFELPANLADGPKPALVLVRAGGAADTAGGPGRMQIFGLGAGPRAVGSVAIEQVDFSPPTVRLSARQKAAYSFLSRSDFNHVAVEVMRIAAVRGEIKVSLARGFRFDGGVGRGEWFGRAEPRTWDGSNAQNQPSLGPHLVQVRAWMAAGDEADWVTAWSARSVQVTE